jgi:NADPH-dependent F420 reductase
MQVGIVAGTGPAGRGLAARLAASELEVKIGSRSAERAEEVASEIRASWPGRALRLSGVDNAGAAACEIVVLATPWEAAVETVAPLADALAGKVIVSMVNALARVGGELQALVPPRGSIAAAVQCALPQSLVSGAFHHLPARELGKLDRELDADVLICADHPDATAATILLVEAVPGLRAVDAGSLSSCAPIEAFTAVLVNVNIINRAHASIRLTGLPRLEK